MMDFIQSFQIGDFISERSVSAKGSAKTDVGQAMWSQEACTKEADLMGGQTRNMGF